MSYRGWIRGGQHDRKRAPPSLELESIAALVRYEATMPKITRKMVLWGVITASFLLMVFISAVIPTASIWFLALMVAFTVLVIGLSPWVLGS